MVELPPGFAQPPQQQPIEIIQLSGALEVLRENDGAMRTIQLFHPPSMRLYKISLDALGAAGFARELASGVDLPETVSREEYDGVCAERDALRRQVEVGKLAEGGDG